MKKESMQTKQFLHRWLPAGILLVLIITAYTSGLHHHLSLENIQAQKETLLTQAQQQPVLFALAFIAVYTIVVAMTLPIATVITLLGGFLFGRWLGTFYVVLGATLGATVIFLIARSSLGESLRGKAGKLYKKVHSNIEENAVSYLLFMRLVPLFPFFLVNIVPALVNVPLRTYVWTTFVGIIPGTFVYTNLGTALGEIDSLSGLISLETLAAFVLLGLFSLLPIFIKKRPEKRP